VLKAELIQIYTQLATHTLPHFINRPLIIIKFTTGIKCIFYSKNKPYYNKKWISNVEVAHEIDTIKYIATNEVAILACTANLAALIIGVDRQCCTYPKIDGRNYSYMDKIVTGYDQELMKGRFAKLKERLKVIKWPAG
jgi:DNA primase